MTRNQKLGAWYGAWAGVIIATLLIPLGGPGSMGPATIVGVVGLVVGATIGYRLWPAWLDYRGRRE